MPQSLLFKQFDLNFLSIANEGGKTNYFPRVIVRIKWDDVSKALNSTWHITLSQYTSKDK